MANQCPKCNREIEFIDSDGVEWETWACTNCSATYEVTIEITRDWDTAVELVTRHWNTAVQLNEEDK